MNDTVLSTRDRILEAALELTSRHGSEGTSMRDLADACDVKVAALYYHFPSKAEILRAVIEERNYDQMMAIVEVPSPEAGSDRERLTALMGTIWEGMRGEEQVWRLLLAESCHHNDEAGEAARGLVRSFEDFTAAWLRDEFSDLAVPVSVGARLMADFLFSNIARVAIGAVTDNEALALAEDLAAVITGDAG